MNKFIVRFSTFLTLVFFAHGALATEVYKDVDEDGVPSFSDVRTDDSETVDIQEPMTFNPQEMMPERKIQYEEYAQDEEIAQKPKIVRYSRLMVTDPPNDSAIRENSGALTLTISIVPGVQEGHTAELVMDGLVIRKLSSSGPVSLANVDRGTHTFQVLVVDGKGKVFDSGPSSSITMLRHVIRR